MTVWEALNKQQQQQNGGPGASGVKSARLLRSQEERQLQLALEASLMQSSSSPQQGSNNVDAMTSDSSQAELTEDLELEMAMKLSRMELGEQERRKKEEEERERREQEELDRILALSLTEK